MSKTSVQVVDAQKEEVRSYEAYGTKTAAVWSARLLDTADD